jgi:hypothetical protein
MGVLRAHQPVLLSVPLKQPLLLMLPLLLQLVFVLLLVLQPVPLFIDTVIWYIYYQFLFKMI